MLDREQIKALVVCRLLAAEESCNSHHLDCVEQQIRTLLAVLTDGDPPVLHGNARIVLKTAEIPFRDCDGGFEFEYDDDWLKAHGFKTKDGDIVETPFGGW